jgi:DNA-binding HxlR family transcriptional regulator
MLSRELKIMEQIGLVTRIVKSTMPVEIIYNETELTHTLVPVFDALLEWGRDI